MQGTDTYTAFTRGIIESNFGIRKGLLEIDGISVASITGQYGTPVYIYGCSIIDKSIETLKSTYPENFSIHYSIKANPNRAIIRHCISRNLGLEIASSGEFKRALESGCDPANIIFAGPGKTYAELETVISGGLGELHIESYREAERAGEIANSLQKPVTAAIRVNPEETSAGAMRMSGKPVQFGIDEHALDKVLEFVINHTRLNFSGIHLFVGTQILDANSLIAHYKKGIEIARKISKQYGVTIKTLDMGGGLGIPYFPGDCSLDLSILRQGLENLVREIDVSPEFAQTRFIIEPGRFLVGESGIYVARVNDIKISKGKKFVILDGGMNHHLAASGNLGQTIKRNFPIAVLNRLDSDATEQVDLVGPLCTPLDTLGRKVPLPPVREGDLIGIFQSGAYARSASPLGFLSHPEPDEVFVEKGEFHIIH